MLIANVKGVNEMSVQRDFDDFWVQYKSGKTPLIAVIIFEKSSRPVGDAQFWAKNQPIPDAEDTGTQTTLHYHIEQLQDVLACLALPGKHRLNFSGPANAQLDLSYA
jgi:hypothetical protein